MADEVQLKILKQGVEVWNRWRLDNPSVAPDLSNAISCVPPEKIGPSGGVNYWEVCDYHLEGARLDGVNLSGANLMLADLRRATLRNADLHDANLMGANLGGADLSGANLARTQLIDTILVSARLNSANLIWAHLKGTRLETADCAMAIIGWTTFADIDLSSVHGLSTVQHGGPSSIGIDTIHRSKGVIPEGFLRSAGVPDNFFSYMLSLQSDVGEFYSCFISYSSKDQKFVSRLYTDLQQRGIRCWFAPVDLKVGARLRISIDESIARYDKLLVVLSRNAIASQYVEQEVETALEKERLQKKSVLLPISLDNAAMQSKSGWPALIRKTHNIGDFRQWKDSGFYEKALGRLIRDFGIEEQPQEHSA